MSLKRARIDWTLLKQEADAHMGGDTRFLSLDWHMRSVFQKEARRMGAIEFMQQPPIWHFTGARHGRHLLVGFNRYELRTEPDGEPIPLLEMHNPFGAERSGLFESLIVVRAEHHARFYRYLRRRVEATIGECLAPIMLPNEEQRLWNNTIGFLRKGAQALQEYGVVLRRGVLLLGQPGNGKTLAARWLQSEAVRNNFEFQTITAEMYMGARAQGGVRDLFSLDAPGLVLFDDFDVALRDRDENGPSADATMFLTELDGIDVRSGVVYVFTSNATRSELDPAFRRPGRIDQMFEFRAPNADLRRRLIVERWRESLVSQIDVDALVAISEGLSFAELEEVKKLMVMHHLDTQTWDWKAAWTAFRTRGDESMSNRVLGFHVPPTPPAVPVTLASERNADVTNIVNSADPPPAGSPPADESHPTE